MTRRRKTPRVEVVIPIGTRSDEWREKALDYVVAYLEEHHPAWKITLGTVPDDVPWSKGAAVADAVDRLDRDHDVLVIHDADSFVTDPKIMSRAVERVHHNGDPWVVPHRMVYRLKQSETERLYGDASSRARIGQVVRTPYIGPLGGGITVLSPKAYRLVGGIDERFEGWGGEDIAFGWMLETLAGRHVRLQGALVHLWHPHPAPTLRGSQESEDLVAIYKKAKGHPRRCEALARRETWETRPPLPDPVRFRMTANRRTLRLFGSDTILRFDREGYYSTTDADEVEALRRIRLVREE